MSGEQHMGTACKIIWGVVGKGTNDMRNRIFFYALWILVVVADGEEQWRRKYGRLYVLIGGGG